MAKGKTLSTVISLGGKVDGSLGKALKASKSQAASAAKAMSKSMTASTASAGRAVSKTMHSMAKGALAVFGVLKAITKLKDFASEAMTAAKAQLEVQTKLSAVLENVKSIQIRGPNAAIEAAKELNKVADALEAVGVIGNDVTVAGMQQLATYQLSDNEISKLSIGMDDLLAQQKGLNATQGDAVTIANMIGKAMGGSVGALSKVGISFTEAQAAAIKTGDATLRAATIAQVLQENVGGVNKALGETDQGQIVQAQNTFDAIKETLGYFLLPLLNQLLKGVLPYVSKGLEKLTAILDKAGPIISDLISKGFEKLSSILPIIMQVISDIIPLINQIFTSFDFGSDLLPSIISIIQTLIPCIIEIVKAIAPLITQLINNLVPAFITMIPPISKLISSLLPVIISLIQSLVPFIMDLVTQIAPLVTSLIDALIPAFEQIIPPIMDIIKKVLPVLISLFKLIVPFIVNLVTQIAPLVTTLINALLPAFEAIIPPIMNLVETLLPPLQTLFTAVFSVIQSLAPVISVLAQIFSAVLGASITTLTPIIEGIIGYFTNIMNTLTTIIDFVVNVFTGNWSAAWDNVKSIFTGIFNSFVDIVKTPLNLVIGIINSAINGINGLTSIINKIPGVEIGEIPQIPYLAKGATVTSPTLAMIGEGKVPETVVPHNSNPRSVALLNEAARGVGLSAGRNNTSILPAIDRISQSLSFFSDNIAGKIRSKPTSDSSSIVDSAGKSMIVNNTNNFSPVIYAKDATGVKEILDDKFEEFKMFMNQWKQEEVREVFG